jgi:hypothetical protein
MAGHDENQFIRNTLAHQPLMAGPHAGEAEAEAEADADADADKLSESAAPDLPGETP